MNIKYNRLEAFMFLLFRDHLTAGELERIVSDVEKESEFDMIECDALVSYAIDCVNRGMYGSIKGGRMIIPRLGRWCSSNGSLLIWERLYWRLRWTPFCRVSTRAQHEKRRLKKLDERRVRG